MRRAVFDTDVVVSALVFKARLAWLRTLWRSGCSPVICSETANQLCGVLAYPEFRLAAVEQHILLDDYLPFAVTMPLSSPLPDLPVSCRDRKDVVFLQLAPKAACPLISGDADLTVLRGAMTIPILSPAELRVLG